MGSTRASQVTVTVNGEPRALEVDNRTSALDLLRERLALTGTEKGCDHGQCGACTVLINGRRVNSCLALVVAHDGAGIRTVEGLASEDTPDLHPMQRAFLRYDAFQCGEITAIADAGLRIGAEVRSSDPFSARPAAGSRDLPITPARLLSPVPSGPVSAGPVVD